MSYEPLTADFIEFMRNCVGGTLRIDDMRICRDAFMAGAASALGRVRNVPSSEDVMLNELEDFANEREAQGGV